MKIITKDLLHFLGMDYIAITTNGTVKKDGTANMGRGNAKLVAEALPELPEILGALLQSKGNHVHYLGHKVFSFPVEETWLSHADITLVERSAKELRSLADMMLVSKLYLPAPGCGKGGLSEKQVLPLLESILDERFIIVQKPEEA